MLRQIFASAALVKLFKGFGSRDCADEVTNVLPAVYDILGVKGRENIICIFLGNAGSKRW